MENVFHKDTFVIPATPEQVRRFIMTPARIADYFPDTLDSGSLEPGKDVWIKAKTGVSLLRLIDEECTDDCLTMIVYNATMHEPFTLESIKSNVIMTMVEDWHTEAHPEGTTLVKVWRDLELFGPLVGMNMVDGIVATGEVERPAIIEKWGAAARAEDQPAG